MTDPAHLQPGDATAWERSIAEAVAAWWPCPTHLIATLWDPWRCPETVLPFLAWALSVDLWDDRWDLAKKRRVVARSVPLSRARGVEPTFAEYLSFVEARLVEFLRPPQGLFPRRHWNAAERAAWRARFPELRVYPFRGRHVRPRWVMVPGEPWFGARSVVRRSVASEFAGRRATLVKGGVDRPVGLRVTVGSAELARGLFEVRLPTTARRLVLPAILGKSFIARNSTADERSYRYADGPARPDLFTPGDLVELTPERVAERHTRPGGFMPGRALPMTSRFSVAREHLYDSLRLYDPAAAASTSAPKRGGWIVGRSKLRQDVFTLRLSADLRRPRRGGFVVGRSLSAVVRSYDRTRSEDGFAAVRAAKLGRTRTLLRTNLHRPIAAGDGLPLDGTCRVGQIVQSL